MEAPSALFAFIHSSTSFATVHLVETKFVTLPRYDAFSFELIDCRDNLSHVVIMKLRMAWKRKTAFCMRFGVWKTARIAADAFPENSGDAREADNESRF